MERVVSQTIFGIIEGRFLFSASGLFLVHLEFTLLTWSSDKYLEYTAHTFGYKIVNTAFETWTQS